MVGAEPQAVLLLAQRLAEHGHLGAQRLGDLDRDVSEPAHADDRDLRARADVPVTQRRVGGDPGAEQRRRHVELDLVGDPDDESLLDDDRLAVAAVGDLAVVVAAVVGQDRSLRAVLLLAADAVLALAARVDEAADADPVADRESRRPPAPTADTVPVISWPGTIGKVPGNHSSRTWWMSLWQMPAKAMSIATSSGRGSRRSIVERSKGAPGLGAWIAFVCGIGAPRIGYGLLMGSRGRKTGLLIALAACLAAAVIPASALATFHENRISEVYPGTALCPDCAFVELQSPSTGENLVNGHTVTFFDKDGVAKLTVTMTANVPNGQSQRTILIADQFPPDAVTADFTNTSIGTNIIPSGGAACFQALDCVAWGNITPTGLAALPSPAGTPAAPGGITNGSSFVRSISPGCATLFQLSDDTNDSATDFSLNADPNPRPNSVAPTETPCVAPTPQTSIDHGPALKLKGKTAKFKFSSPDAGATFQCKLDKKPYKSCTSPLKLKKLKLGKHVFRVRAVLGGTPDPTPATYSFKRIKK